MFKKKISSSLFLKEYPEKLNKYWIHVTEFKNPNRIKYCVSFYKNNKYAPGTIIVSDYILNDYPDLYLTIDRNLLANRVYTSPELRPSGAWKWIGVLTRLFFYNNMGQQKIDVPSKRSLLADIAYNNTKKILKEKHIYKKNQVETTAGITEPPRDFMYPTIWYNKRIKEVLKNENS
jgi:hypothetical protein